MKKQKKSKGGGVGGYTPTCFAMRVYTGHSRTSTNYMYVVWLYEVGKCVRKCITFPIYIKVINQ